MSAAAETMEKVAEMMGEHFDGFLVIGIETIGAGREAREAIRMEIGGGTHAAIGLAERAKHELLSTPSEFEPDAACE